MAFLALVSLAACGDDDGSPPDSGGRDAGVDAAAAPDTGAVDAGTTDLGALDAGGCAGDGNDLPAGATEIELGTDITDAIGCEGDADYFTFEGALGDWVWITVTADVPPGGQPVDSVLTLFDADEQRLAENDDARVGLGRVDVNAGIVTRLPADGRYLVRVLDYGTWRPGEAPLRGGPELTYRLRVSALDATHPMATIDPETGDDAASATPLRLAPTDLFGEPPADMGWLVGTFRDASDVDVFEFDMAGDEPSSVFVAAVHNPGSNAGGSSSRCGHVWITRAEGGPAIGRIDNRDVGYWRLTPTLPAGRYRLWVEHPGGSAGPNDFYVMALTRSRIENPREQAEAANDKADGAEPVPFAALPGGGRQAYVLSFLTDVDDLDYWSFELAAGEVIGSIGCSAAWEGSGVRGFALDVRDAANEVLATESEEEVFPEQIYLAGPQTGITGPGTYFVRLSKTGQDPEVEGTWARCGITIGAAM